MENTNVFDQEVIQKELMQLALEDPEYKEWFSTYRRDTWEKFIESYAEAKKTALNEREKYLKILTPKSQEFREEAQEALAMIQQKKLFDLQCLWRAENITLPFVQTSWDFKFWENYIMECPFLLPVSEEEIDLFIKFLGHNNFEWPSFMVTWQDYEEFKKHITGDDEDEQGEEPPSWYSFHDQMTGSGQLLTLPDTRSEKEDKYQQLHWEKFRKENPYVPAPPNPENSKAWLHSPYYQEMLEFARNFETDADANAILSYLIYWKKEHESYVEYSELDDDFEYLKTIDGEFTLVQHDDWKESIRLTVELYKNTKIAQYLPGAWRRYYRKEVGKLSPEEYRMKRIKNFKYSDEHIKSTYYFLAQKTVKDILDGRELAGEPRDLDF